MAKIIAVANRKGGVGKTTTAICLAHFLGRRDTTVLLIDLDPQNALSAALLPPRQRGDSRPAPTGEQTEAGGAPPAPRENDRLAPQPGAIDIIRGHANLTDVVTRTRLINVDLIPYGSPGPISDEDEPLFAMQDKRAAFARSVSELSKSYRYVLVDSPPGSSAVVQFALFLADSVIIPLQCQPLALRIMPRILSDIKQLIDTANPSLKVEGVLLTMYEFWDPVSQSIAGQVWSFFPRESTFRAVIRRSPVFERIFNCEGNPLVREDLPEELLDYDVIAQLILAKGEQDNL